MAALSTPVRDRQREDPAPATRRRRRPPLAPYGFLLPALVLFVAFMLIPIVYVVYLSFFGERRTAGGPFGIKKTVFVGLDNYVSTLADPALLAGLGRVAVYGLIAVPLTLGLALTFAVLLDAGVARGVRFSRTAIFIPYAVPGVVASLLWGFMYLPATSPFSYVTQKLGLSAIPFLDNPLLIPSVSNIAIWGGVGFNMIIIYTSLRGIPSELIDSARVDGCSGWQLAWRIKIPLVVPALVLTGLFSLIGTLQVYGEPVTLSPMTTTISTTWVPLMTIYRNAFTFNNLPLASAASVLLALGTVVLSLILLKATQKRAFGDGA